MAPARDGASGSSGGQKVDLLSVILSVIGGAKNQSNFCFIGSTNRRDKMDEAFMRRMDFKIYVGKNNEDVLIITHHCQLLKKRSTWIQSSNAMAR